MIGYNIIGSSHDHSQDLLGRLRNILKNLSNYSLCLSHDFSRDLLNMKECYLLDCGSNSYKSSYGNEKRAVILSTMCNIMHWIILWVGKNIKR
jgi:hypothetical protein